MKTKQSQLEAGRKYYLKNKKYLDRINNAKGSILRKYGWLYVQEHLINLGEVVKKQVDMMYAEEKENKGIDKEV